MRYLERTIRCMDATFFTFQITDISHVTKKTNK